MSQNKSDLLEPPFAHPSEGHHSDVAPLASGNHDRNRRSKAFPAPAATGFGLTTGEGSPELGSLGLGGTIKGIMSPLHEVDAATASPAVNHPNNLPPTPARAKPLHMPEPPSSHALSPEEIAEPPLAVMSRSRAPFHAPMPATAAPLGQVRTAQRRPAPAPAPVEAMGERAPVGKGGTVVGEAAINFPGLAPSPAGFAGPGGTVVADERMPGKNQLLPAGPGGTVVADDSDPHFAALIGSSKSPPSRRSAPPRAMPKRIGQYELIRELGRGGMGVVYLARDSRLGRRVAVKLLQTDSAELTSRFIVEAQATAQCDHENIVVIYEVGEHQGSPFMVLEYLQGQTLSELLSKSGAMQWARAVDIVVAVMRALIRAHSQGIVHRDLKPENIFLTDGGAVKVLDFGIAKVLREEAGGAGPGATDITARNAMATGLAGTMAYMSPEQWESGSKVDHRTDIWAIGIILFELLTGEHPLLGDIEHFQRRVMDLNDPMPSVRKLNSEIVPELAEVVDRCLAKRPEDRFEDAEALLKALEPFLPGRFRAWGDVDRGPYTGLRAFQEEDAACFFGRGTEVSAMVARVFDHPMVAVVGPSGIGKSSLIRAGVVPALRSFGTNWRILVVRPGGQPLVALAGMLQELREGLEQTGFRLEDPVNLGIRLKMEPGYLGQILRESAQHSNIKNMVFVDQFEELYTLCDSIEQRQAFTQCLTGAADDPGAPVRLMISVRADFLGRISEDAAFMTEISRGLFFLGPPGPESLREALVQPAQMVGYRFETEEMVSEMISHLQSTPGALPLLQFTAFQLWQKRDAARKLLTKQSYDALGGIAGALATHADQIVQKMTPDARNICRALFLQLVTPERTRAIRELDELYELVTDKNALKLVLRELVDSRLLVLNTGGGGGGATVEIVHESLIEAWRTLRRWLEESHEDSMFLEQLRAAARQWSAKKKDTGLLWTGEMAEELFRFRRRFKGELSEIVRAYSDAVESHLHRRARLKKLAAISGVGFLLLLLASAVVALIVISRAHQETAKNEKIARLAKAEAEQRLEDLQAKERARQLEAEKRALAESEVKAANTTIDQTKEQLALRNRELENALVQAEDQRRLAMEAQVEAERNERAAREAEERARKLLQREQERAEKLVNQLGSPVVEVLK